MKSSRTRYWATLVLILIATSVFAQAKKDNLGKEFFVAFAANQGAGSDFAKKDTACFVLYITSPTPASGSVDVPGIDFHTTFTTTPGQITNVFLPDGDGATTETVEVRTSEAIAQGMGVHITADTEISVYGLSHKRYSSDAFLAMPVDVLGKQYRTLCYQSSQLTSIGANTPPQFWIVATEDATTVSITPTAKTATGQPANVQFDVQLNRGDAYLVQGERDVATSDLTGSLVEADKPIAVFSGHERTEIPDGVLNLDPADPSRFRSTSRDHLVEQLPPLGAWGDSAFVIPFATMENPDLVRILSAVDNNTIVINGAQTVTLDAGTFYEIKELTAPIAITGTGPILVGQYMHTSKFGINSLGEIDPVNPAYGDPALVLAYPVEQFTRRYTFVSVVNPTAFQGNYVNVVVRSSGVIGMMLDDQSIDIDAFKPIPGSSFMYAQLPLAQGTHTINGEAPFGITVYGMGGVDSYAYPGCALLQSLNPYDVAEDAHQAQAFTLGTPFPHPASSSDILIPYDAAHSATIQWELFDALGNKCFTSREQTIAGGEGVLTINKELLRHPGVHLFRVNVSSVGTYTTKVVVIE